MTSAPPHLGVRETALTADGGGRWEQQVTDGGAELVAYLPRGHPQHELVVDP
ncbi:hypothetical protein AB0C65_35705 [Nocardia sp. NPDC048505]|uniref:hypothetical protein n=1 Tax=Nocardia sp. NPDC048505 TaxID=3155756 RepID=UPI0033FB1BB6